MSNSNSDFFGDLFASCCGERKPKKVSPAKLQSQLSFDKTFLSSSSFLPLNKILSGEEYRSLDAPRNNPHNSSKKAKSFLDLCGDLMSL